MASIYLQPSEYTTFGLPATLQTSLVVRMSALIDGFCHRPILSTQYPLEQIRLPAGRNRGILSRSPILSIDAFNGRYGYPRRGASDLQVFPAASLLELSAVFGGPPQWEAGDPTGVTYDPHTGEAWFPAGIFSAQYTDVQVTYTAGNGLNPPAVPTLGTAAVGGAIAGSQTMYAKTTVTATAGGETNASAEATIAIPGGTNTNTVTVTGGALPSGASAVNVYLANATGAEILAGSYTTGTGMTFTALPASTAAAPTLNTSLPQGVKTACALLVFAYLERAALLGMKGKVTALVASDHTLIDRDISALLEPYRVRVMR